MNPPKTKIEDMKFIWPTTILCSLRFSLSWSLAIHFLACKSSTRCCFMNFSLSIGEGFGEVDAGTLLLVVWGVGLLGTCCDWTFRTLKLNWPPLTNSVIVLPSWSKLTIGGYCDEFELVVAGTFPFRKCKRHLLQLSHSKLFSTKISLTPSRIFS